MPRFEKDGHVVETSVPVECVQLRASGYAESKARTKAVKEADAAPTPDTGAP